MNIIVTVKYVPDSTGERRFGADNAVDRKGGPGLLSELDEYAVEQALQIVERDGEGEVIVLTMGPEAATDAIRKALQMGAHKGVLVSDSALAGSDALATSLVLATAIQRLPHDLVVCGMASTDAVMGVVPAMLAERLGLAQVTNASQVEIAPGKVTVRRDTDIATETIEAELPVVLSVTDQTGEPRYPSLRGIMAAKKKEIEILTLADLDLAQDQVGWQAAATTVEEIVPRPPRAKGEIVGDEDGAGAKQLVAFLTANKFN